MTRCRGGRDGGRGPYLKLLANPQTVESDGADVVTVVENRMGGDYVWMALGVIRWRERVAGTVLVGDKQRWYIG